VHELCHLAELNHGRAFWQLVAQQIPDYQTCVAELRAVDRLGGSITKLIALQTYHQQTVGDKTSAIIE
jgi:hypothetical protein